MSLEESEKFIKDAIAAQGDVTVALNVVQHMFDPAAKSLAPFVKAGILTPQGKPCSY